jgi:HlyD family secretion protein
MVWLMAAGAAAVGVWALMQLKTQPPEVQFGKVLRETITSSVPTNGKVEPIEWAVAKAERAGAVEKILIQRGQQVGLGADLVELDSSEARASLASAQARMAQARAELDVLRRGGRPSDLAEITSGLDRAHLDLQTAQKELDSLERLQTKQYATTAEVNAARQKVDQAKLAIESFERRKQSLVSPSDQAAAQARFDDAQAAASLAETQIHQSVIRAPIAGTVYEFDLKPGAYLRVGDSIASIGRLDQVRVNVYVDEPDLGRVAKGMPVAITWDALPGRHWAGEVDRTPTQIVALGSRQVGEVVCVIRNPDRDLLPGTNVNAEILAQSVPDALTILKEAVRNEHGQPGVFVLSGDRVEWKKVTQGVSNTTRTQVDGLNEGDAVALYSDKALTNGMVVKPVFP